MEKTISVSFRSTHSCALVLLAVLSAGSVAAEREEIQVSATRVTENAFDVPAALSVLGQEQVQLARQQLALDESLVQVPGVFLQNRYNFAQDLRVAIRGFGARGSFGVRGVKILVDGIPNTLPDGQGQFDSLDIGSIGQVEVLRGASSALYGNASGGLINIQSELAPDQPFLELRSAVGEYGYAKSQIKSAGRNGKVDYLVSAAHLEMEGYRQQSDVQSSHMNSRVRIQLDEQSDLTLVLNLLDSPQADDPGGIDAAAMRANPKQARNLNLLYDTGEAIEQQKVGVSYRRSFSSDRELVLRGYSLWRDFANQLPFFGGGIVNFDRLFVGGGAQWRDQLSLFGIDSRMILGVDVDRQADDRQRFNNAQGARGALVFDQDEEVISLGVYWQQEWFLSDAFELTTGLRYDRIEFDVDDRFLGDGDDSGDRDMDALSVNLGLMWRIQEDMNLYATLGSAFETPTTTELANPLGGGFNQAVDAQEAVNYELGLRGALAEQRFSYDVALFVTKVEDELTPYELAANPGRTYYENAGRSTRRGVEMALGYSITQGLDLALAYTYSDFEFDRFNNANGTRFDGSRLPGVPQQLANLSVNYRHANGFFAGLDWLYVGSLYADNANRAKVQAYDVASLRMGWQLQWADISLTPFLGVNNLFDEAYAVNVRINAFGARYFEPAPQRHYYAGATLRFGFN